MTELIDMIMVLYDEIKMLKAHMRMFEKTRMEQFNETWISGDQVTESLEISRRTLQNLRDNGTLPHSRINGKIYYKLSDLEYLLENNYTGTDKNEEVPSE